VLEAVTTGITNVRSSANEYGRVLDPFFQKRSNRCSDLIATHVSVVCYHVKEEFLPQFLRHLENMGIVVPEPPQAQGSPEVSYVKVNVEEGASEQRLQKVLDNFVRRGQPMSL
jgi:hypothetical protein